MYRRAFSLYSEYFPKFLKLSFLAHIPVIVVSIVMSAIFIVDKYSPKTGAVHIAVICGMVSSGLYFKSSATSLVQQ